jgi:multidrug efflux system membrane fusion protein
VASSFRFHRIAAVLVLIGAAAWVGTGEFASVGSHSAHAEGTAEAATVPAPEAPAEVETKRTVAVVTPVFEDHARRINLSGATEPDKRAVLAARSEGIVAELTVAKGGMVAADALIMSLEGPEIVAQARIAEIALDQRERELKTAERLYSSGNTPEIQLTNARSARDSAAAQLTLAKAAQDRLTLIAPFAGLVDQVNIEKGEWVTSGTPIATILSLDPIIVRAEVSELDIGEVHPGATAKVKLVNGLEMEGKVRFVAREASSDTRTFPVEIALPNPDGSIPSGMTATVDIFAAPTRAVKIPRSVITLSEQGEIGVRVVGDDNIARFAAVGIVDDTEDGLVVTGIPENVRIVVAGQDLVRDGEEVVVSDAPLTAAAVTTP